MRYVPALAFAVTALFLMAAVPFIANDADAVSTYVDPDDQLNLCGYITGYDSSAVAPIAYMFVVHKEIDETLLSRSVPRLILQPIAENAVEHDMTRSGGGELWLRAYRQGRMLVLEVEHEGSMTEADRDKVAAQLRNTSDFSGSVGIQNVNQRLKLIYGEDGSLSLDETGRGTILARISFPDAEEGEKAE